MLGMRTFLPWLLLGWSLLFWPGLRRRMLLTDGSLLLGCRPLLPRGLLMLRLYQLVLRDRLLLYRPLLLGYRAFLGIWMHLRSGPLLVSRAQLLGWPLRLRLPYLLRRRRLQGWPGLWSLLGNACPWYRPLCLRGVQGRGSRQWTLLYSRSLNWLAPLDGERPVHYNRLRLAAVDGRELGTVGAGSYPVLLLDPQLRQTRLPQCRQLCRGRRQIHSAAATAVAHAVVVRDVGDVRDVGIVDDGGVNVRDPTVVIEVVVAPISAVVATANIAVAVIHTAIVANIAAPKAAVPAVAPRIVAPVSGRPQRASIGSRDPDSRNPVITGLRVRPIAWRPQIIWSGTRRLLVFG